MSTFSNVSKTAFLIADPSRATILMELADGRALPAGELARASGVTAQTASAHLAKLLDGGLISVETQGRHRYYRLSDSHVAQTLEHLAAIGPIAKGRPRAFSPQHKQLAFCRRCYDHLAGKVGVTMTHAMQARDYIRPAEDKQYIVTAAGAQWLSGIGVDIEMIAPSRRGLARQCLDWTERTHHLAGPLGTRLMAALCDQGWLRRSDSTRVVVVTPKGWMALQHTLGMTKESVAKPA